MRSGAGTGSAGNWLERNRRVRIGVDGGGTFTDFVILHDDGRLESFKLRSNPAAPAAVILAGIARATGGRRAEVVHGSTVATNALLERKGAKTAFVTTAGFTDLVFIGRQNRPQLYNLTPALRRPLILASLCFGVAEREARRPARFAPVRPAAWWARQQSRRRAVSRGCSASIWAAPRPTSVWSKAGRA